jgi:tetratricopeptide (TPR) repeat protein
VRNPEHNTAASPQPRTRRQRALRAVVVIAVPLLLLALLPLGLRVAGVGYSKEIATVQLVGGRERYCSNPKLGWFFAARTEATQLSPFAFDVEKAPDTYRIFVLGGSAAQGQPDPAFSFSRILEIMLAHAYPATHFEVINVALEGITSQGARHIAKSCARYGPDLMITYLDPPIPPDAMPDARVSQDFEQDLRDICGVATKAGAKILLGSVAFAPSVQNPAPPINEASANIATALAASGVHGVDTAAAVAAVPADSKAFYGPVHLRFAGHYAVARAIYETIDALQLIAASASGAPPLDENGCKARLVYSPLDHYQSLRATQKQLSEQAGATRPLDVSLLEAVTQEAEAIRPTLQPYLKDLLPRYRDAIQAHPTDWQLRWKVADYAFRHYKNYRLAAAQAEEILRALPHSGAQWILMKIAIQEGRLDDAERLARSTIERLPAHPPARFDLAEIHKMRGEYEEAITHFKQGIRLRPGNQAIVAYTYLAELYEAVGNTGKAIKTLQRGTEGKPRQHAAPAYVNLAILQAEHGQEEAARRSIRTALETFPANEITRKDEVIRLLEQLGETELAETLGE